MDLDTEEAKKKKKNNPESEEKEMKGKRAGIWVWSGGREGLMCTERK